MKWCPFAMFRRLIEWITPRGVGQASGESSPGPLPSTVEEDAPDREAFDRVLREKQALEKRVEELARELNSTDGQAAALHFKVYSLSKENETLTFNVAGLRGQIESYEKCVAELRRQIAELQRRDATRGG